GRSRRLHSFPTRRSSDLRLRSLLEIHGWIVDTSRRARTDVELLCLPGRGRFTLCTDCRVLACFDESLFGRIDSRAAHVVLSPSGDRKSTRLNSSHDQTSY